MNTEAETIGLVEYFEQVAGDARDDINKKVLPPSVDVDAAVEKGVLRETGPMRYALTEEALEGYDGSDEPEDAPSNPRLNATEPDEDDGEETVDRARVLEAFETVVEYYHSQLDHELPDECDVDADTPREYFEDVRGWDRETVEEKRLGYAPAGHGHELLDRLMRFSTEEILATGLFYDPETPHFEGRVVFPYHNEDAQPCYAISRTIGHPEDPKDEQKYTKAVKAKDYSHVDEPIFGLRSIGEADNLDRILVAGGIADAITLHEAGYPCISPVTTVQFKGDHRDDVDEILDDNGADMYVINDAERPTVNKVETDGDVSSIREALSITQHGEGLRGAFSNAEYFGDDETDVYIVNLPGGDDDLRKLDPDDFVHEDWASVETVLEGAKPAECRDDFNEWAARTPPSSVPEKPSEQRETGVTSSSSSALFDLDFSDVSGLRKGHRGDNPFGHHGNSHDYFVVCEDGGGTVIGYDHKHGVSYYPLPYLLVDAGERRADSPNGDLDDGEIFEAWRHAKEGGLIPTDDTIPRRALRHVARDATDWDGDLVEHETRDGETFEGLPSAVYRDALEYIEDDVGLETGRHRPSGGGSDEDDAKPAALLPPVENRAVETEGFIDHGGEDLLQEARDRAEETVVNAVASDNRAVVEALPTLGKSRGAVKAAAETDEQVTILTSRRDLYDQVVEWAEEFGVSVQRLPSFFKECPTASGEHGDEWKRRVKKLYNAGVPAREIHATLDMPCQDGTACPYSSAWDRVDDDADILVGHYAHAHVPRVRQGRAVVFDEFVEDRYTYTIEPSTVSSYLEDVAVPFDDFTDLLEGRSDEDRRASAVEYLTGDKVELHDTKRAADAVAAGSEGHAYAPAAVLGLLVGEDLGNGWTHADVSEVSEDLDAETVTFDKEEALVYVHAPPSLDYSRGLVALDGTPTLDMWETALGTRLNHRQVLTDDERRAYIRDALNLSVVQTTDYMKPYSSGDSVNVAKDEALLDAVANKHDRDVDLISTHSALSKYPGERENPEDDPVVEIDGVGDVKHYNAVKGSNDFKRSRLGAVVGSPHYGDRFVEKWAALMGEASERGEGKGENLSYGPTGDKVHAHMTEKEVAQAVLRFGRDGNGAVVYVATGAVPDWLPVEEKPPEDTRDMVRRTRSDAERDVIRALTEDGCRTTAELAEVVDVTKQQIRNITEKLEEEGLVAREKAGRAYNYAPTAAVCDASDLADVDLADVDLEVVEEDETRPSEAAVNPNSTYIVHTRFLGVRDNSDGAKRREEVVGSSTCSNGTVEEVVGPPDDT